MALRSLYGLDEKILGEVLKSSPEDILRATSYEVEDTLLRLGAQDFVAFIKNASRDVVNHLVENVSSEGVFVLFFRIPDEYLQRFIFLLKPSATTRLISLLIKVVSPDIIIRRIDRETLFYILDSLKEDVLSQFVMLMSPTSLRRILEHGGVLLQVDDKARLHLLSAYRMGDMVKWGVYIVQSLLENIDKESWKVLAPRLSGKDWNMVFTALSEDRILQLLEVLDRRVLRRLIRRIDKHLFMSFLMTVGDAGSLLRLISDDLTMPGIDIDMTLHIYRTDKKRAISILKNTPLAMISSFIKKADSSTLKKFADMLRWEKMETQFLFSLDADASFKLYSALGDKEVHDSLLKSWLLSGVDVSSMVPHEMVCKLISSMNTDFLNMLPAGNISMCLLESGMYKYLSTDNLWKHLLAIPPSHQVLKELSIPWNHAPAEVLSRHRDILSQVLIGIPDDMLTLMFKDGIPEDAPLELVRRWAFLSSTDTARGVKVLLDREMYKDAYKLMIEKGEIIPEALTYVIEYADDEFIDNVIISGYGSSLLKTPIFATLSGDKKAMLLLSIDEHERLQILRSMPEDDIWDMVLSIDDVDILRELIRGIALSGEKFVLHKDKLKREVLCLLADYVEDLLPLFEYWPEGVRCSSKMQREASYFTKYLDDDTLIFLICSGDIEFSERYAHLVSSLPISCLMELPETWKYLSAEKLKNILVQTKSCDIQLWERVYMQGVSVEDAPTNVKYNLWKKTGNRGLLSEDDIRVLVKKHPDIAVLMSPEIWKEFIGNKEVYIFKYFPMDMWKYISEEEARILLGHVPGKVEDMLSVWDRKRAVSFLARYFPDVLISLATESDIEYALPYIDKTYIPQLITKYPHLMWKEICHIDEKVDIEVDLAWLNDEEELECLKDKTSSLRGEVRFPVHAKNMKWLYPKGLITPEAVCESLKRYGRHFLEEGYIPSLKYISCLDVPEDAESIYRLVNLGWWEHVPLDKKLDILRNAGNIQWEKVPLDEELISTLWKENIISTVEVIKKGYTHIVADEHLDVADAISLYQGGYLSLSEAYHMCKEIVWHLDIKDVEYLVAYEGYIPPEDMFKRLSPPVVYNLLKKGAVLSYDAFPTDFEKWIVEHGDFDRDILPTLPQHLKIDILKLWLLSKKDNTEKVWLIVDEIGIPDALPILLEFAGEDVWHDISPEILSRLLMYPSGMWKDILSHVPPETIGKALMLLEEEDILNIMYMIKPYGEAILRSFSPSEVVSSSLKLLLPLASDSVIREWIERFPQEAYTYLSVSAYMYTVKDPCVLKMIDEGGIRRLVENAPEDVLLEIIRRSYRQCRDVAGKVIKVYGTYHGLRPSEVMVKAGLVSNR